MSEIDWNTELKKIERQFDGLPAEPTAADLRARREADRETQLRREERALAFGAACRLAVVVALAVAINFWPYARGCGFGLLAYLGAGTAVVLGGLWAGVWTWRGRTAAMHALAMLAVAWGVVLITAQLAPRTLVSGSAAGSPPTWWWCPAPASTGVAR